MFEVIEDSVAYSDRIVRDLLEYSQELELELSEATIKLMVSDAVRQVEIPKNITISDPTSDETIIRVDTTKITRIFVNLIEVASVIHWRHVAIDPGSCVTHFESSARQAQRRMTEPKPV
jgi:K+-sensing histidine kinase KdpD